MKQSEKNIIDTAKKVLDEIGFLYDLEIGLKGAKFYKEDKLIRGVNKGQIIPAWVVALEFGKPYFVNESAFLTIADETGEPLYLQHSTAVIEIEKYGDGKYRKK